MGFAAACSRCSHRWYKAWGLSPDDENLAVFRFHLDEAAIQAINETALGKECEQAVAVFERLGECGNKYRAMH